MSEAVSSRNGQGVPPPLSGGALRAAVGAAEAPLTGELVKAVFFRQLGIEAMLRLDLDAMCGGAEAPEAAVMAVVAPARSEVSDGE